MKYKLYAPSVGWYVGDAVKLFIIGIVCSFLFYNRWWGLFITLPYLIYLHWKDLHAFKSNRKRILRDDFKDVVVGLSAALSAGYSMENALAYVLAELTKSGVKNYMREELKLMMNKVSCGEGIHEAMRELGEKSGIPEISQLAGLLAIGKKYGGNIIYIFRQFSASMAEKSSTELEINTMIASKRLEGRIMTIMPFAIMLYLRITEVSYSNVLYDSLFGHIFMTICLGVTIGMTFVIDKITAIEAY